MRTNRSILTRMVLAGSLCLCMLGWTGITPARAQDRNNERRDQRVDQHRDWNQYHRRYGWNQNGMYQYGGNMQNYRFHRHRRHHHRNTNHDYDRDHR